MITDRRSNRRWAHRNFRSQPRAAFHHRPAAVSATADQMNHLPGFPAIVGDINLVGLRINAELPRIAQSVAKDLGASSFVFDKGIIGRDGILLIG